jgi:cytochrome d ubiquinol oxidase subunit I
MSDPLLWHRLQFAFTIVFHYLFPQLTMGLALLIVLMKAIGLRTGDRRWDDAARFWIRIFGVNFAVGVVTGIPMEFQFGTNWANFTRYAGGVVGHTLAMEGLFAFFLESSFLGLLVFGERRLGRRGHFLAALALFAGSWLSGYFIICTNAFMQHPVGHVVAADGTLQLGDFWAFLLNPWALAQYAHTMMASVVTASFVVAAVGAFYALQGLHPDHAPRFLRMGVAAGLVSSVLVAFPTGDQQAKLVARHQPVALAAMEGHFESETGAGIVMIGQPNVKERRLDNPIAIPGFLSFLAYGTFHSNVKGLNEFSEDLWPDNVELLYYSFHIMAGLGTLFILVMGLAALLAARGALARSRPMLWALMLAFPFPYIATTTGWMTAELGRQPWLVYGLMRTADGASPLVHSGTALFTLIGFTGLYFVLGVLFLFLVGREIAHGPGPLETHAPETLPPATAEAPRG